MTLSRPVSPYTVVQPNLVVTGPTGTPYPGQGATEPVLGNPVHGYLPAVAAAIGAVQGFAGSGSVAPNYGPLAGGSGASSGAPAGSPGGGPTGGGGCGCG